MSEYLDKAKEIRADGTRHYNCAQGVLVPFAAKAGLDEETAYRLAANFGSGMKMGSVCGAVTGGLMVLGLFGVEGASDVSDLYRAVKENHDGCLDCRDLLRLNAERGGEKKPHCDGMVFEVVELAEEILKSKGIL